MCFLYFCCPMDKYKNKYRATSHRKPYWDYSANALYFLTIVTQNRTCILGNIVNAAMVLSEMGKIVNDEFLKSFEIRDELFLCEYVVMPNHLHTIVEIRRPDSTEMHKPNHVETHGRVSPADHDVKTHNLVSPADRNVKTHGRVSLHDKKQPESPNDLPIKRKSHIRLPKSISSFMAGFKSAVNTQMDNYIDEHHLQIPKYNRNNLFFQSDYHDHIIRNHFEYLIITNYIAQNPANWGSDTLNTLK